MNLAGKQKIRRFLRWLIPALAGVFATFVVWTAWGHVSGGVVYAPRWSGYAATLLALVVVTAAVIQVSRWRLPMLGIMLVGSWVLLYFVDPGPLATCEQGKTQGPDNIFLADDPTGGGVEGGPDGTMVGSSISKGSTVRWKCEDGDLAWVILKIDGKTVRTIGKPDQLPKASP